MSLFCCIFINIIFQGDRRDCFAGVCSLKSQCRIANFTHDGKGTLDCFACTHLPIPPGTHAHPGRHTYDITNGLSFPAGTSLPAKFKNLKQRIKDHMKSEIHLRALGIVDKHSEVEKKNDARSKVISMRMARKVYFGVKEAMTYDEFERSCLLDQLNGLDIGDINHSSRFFRGFRTTIYEIIQTSASKFITRVSLETAFRPVLNIIVDKATYKHRTRQVIAAVIVVKDGWNLLEALFLGMPVVHDHTGKGLAENLKGHLDLIKIEGKQIVGVSVDGQYIHDNVEGWLKVLYGNEQSTNIYFNHGPMHR